MENITVHAQTILLQNVVTSMANGMSQKEACQVHGIHVRTFQREIQKHPEIVQSVIEVERNALRERYAEVVENRLKAVDKIIEFSENIESLPIKAVMDIERRLASIQVELEGKSILTNASPDADALAKAAAAYLDALPKLQRASVEGHVIEEETGVSSGSVVVLSPIPSST